MANQVYANNASAVLASSITDSATTITVATGQGASFPTVSGGNWAYITLVDTSGNLEIVKCTYHLPASDSFSCIRGQDGTTARAFSANDLFELRVTKATLDTLRDIMSCTSGSASGLESISFATSGSGPCLVTSSTGSTRKIISNSGTNSQYSLGTSPYLEFKTALAFFDNTSADPGTLCATISTSGISTTQTVNTSVLDVTGNSTLGNGTSDTVTVGGYFSGTTSFGTSAWPTTVLAKSSDRVLVGNEGALALWNENNAVGAYCSLYLGAKHNSVATAIAGGLIRAGTESTDYSGFMSFLTQNSAGTYVEKLRIASTGYITAPGVYANTSASAANVFVDSSGVLYRSTSSQKYKEDVRPLGAVNVDLFQPIRYKSKKRETDGNRDYIGFLAEDLHAAGLSDVVQYDANGDPDGVMYERIVVVLMAELKALRQRVAALENAQ